MQNIQCCTWFCLQPERTGNPLEQLKQGGLVLGSVVMVTSMEIFCSVHTSLLSAGLKPQISFLKAFNSIHSVCSVFISVYSESKCIGFEDACSLVSWMLKKVNEQKIIKRNTAQDMTWARSTGKLPVLVECLDCSNFKCSFLISYSNMLLTSQFLISGLWCSKNTFERQS